LSRISIAPAEIEVTTAPANTNTAGLARGEQDLKAPSKLGHVPEAGMLEDSPFDWSSTFTDGEPDLEVLSKLPHMHEETSQDGSSDWLPAFARELELNVTSKEELLEDWPLSLAGEEPELEAISQLPPVFEEVSEDDTSAPPMILAHREPKLKSLAEPLLVVQNIAFRIPLQGEYSELIKIPVSRRCWLLK
jgi:hypothetical protein